MESFPIHPNEPVTFWSIFNVILLVVWI